MEGLCLALNVYLLREENRDQTRATNFLIFGTSKRGEEYGLPAPVTEGVPALYLDGQVHRHKVRLGTKRST
jgi:hypothetical protein